MHTSIAGRGDIRQGREPAGTKPFEWYTSPMLSAQARYQWDVDSVLLETVTAGDLRWLRNAMRAALDSVGGYRLGAVAVRGGSVLGRGANRHRNDPLATGTLDREAWSVHAEQACLRGIRSGRARGGTLYVARLSPAGRPRLARPCGVCAAVARSAGINKVVYTTNGGAAAERL